MILIVQDGQVVNAVVGSLETVQSMFPDALCVESDDGGVGWTWDGEKLVQPPLLPPSKEDLKLQRELAVGAIKVTVSSGKEFDGNEDAQGRMARAIIGLQAAGVGSIRWVLADNTATDVTLAELTEALVLSGQEQSRLWVIE